MKKKLLSLLLAVVMITALLAGCSSSSSDSSSDSSSSDTSDSGEVDYGSGEITVWVADAVVDLTQEACDQFMEDNGLDYTVTVEACGEGDAASNVITDVDGAADIYGFAQDQLTRIIAAGGLQPLSEEYVTWVNESNDTGAASAAT